MSDTDIQNCLRGFAMHDREKRGTVRLCELKEVMLSTLEEELRDDEVFEVRHRSPSPVPRAPQNLALTRNLPLTVIALRATTNTTTPPQSCR